MAREEGRLTVTSTPTYSERTPPERAPSGFPSLLFFDLDGTLLAPGSVLTPRTLTALRQALACGATLALATGGFSHRARRLAKVIDGGAGRTWAISHNGAAIWDPSNRLASSSVIPAATMAAVLERTDRRAWCVFEALHGPNETAVFFAGRQRADLRHFLWGPADPDAAPDAGARARPVRRRRQEAPSGRVLDSVLGCWILGTPEALAAVDAEAGGGALRGGRYLAWSQRLAQILGRPRLRIAGRDVGPLGTHKGAAAAWLAARLSVPAADVAAFGDATNDVELLRYAGTAVCMANATPDVMAEARLVAPSNREDGVAQMLERWLQDGRDLRDSAPCP